MASAAVDVYEIVVQETAVPTSWFRSALSFLASRDASPNAAIISVVHRETGVELFRHIEEMDDDDDHLLAGIQRDLASMTADEFAVRWG